MTETTTNMASQGLISADSVKLTGVVAPADALGEPKRMSTNESEAQESHECPECGDSFGSDRGVKIHHAKSHGESIAGVTVECSWCGSSVNIRPNEARKNDRAFCDCDCQSNWQSENWQGEDSPKWSRVEVSCDFCGKSVSKIRAKANQYDRNFCGRECKNKWSSEHMSGPSGPLWKSKLVECDFCGEEHWKAPHELEAGDHNFCSESCAGDHHSKQLKENHPRSNQVVVNCDWCGEEIQKTPSELHGKNNIFCGYECMGHWRSENVAGPEHPCWKADSVNKYGPNWRRQRRSALDRDQHRCQSCGMTEARHMEEHGCELHVHHIKRRSKFTTEDGDFDHERANRLENLITLCQSCHSQYEGVPIDIP